MVRPSTFLMACLVMAAAAMPLRASAGADPDGEGEVAGGVEVAGESEVAGGGEVAGSLDDDLPAPGYLEILGLALSIDLETPVDDTSTRLVESFLPPAAADGQSLVLTSPLEDAVQEAVPAAVFDRTEPPIGRYLLSIPVVWF